MNRRAIAALAAAAAFGAGLIVLTAVPRTPRLWLPFIASESPQRFPLRGAAVPHQYQVCSDVAQLGAAWWYNWRTTPGDCDTPGFVPMVWGRITSTPVLTDGGQWLLGFNEPNYPTQANLTPQEARAMWPLLEATGRKLVSPAVGHCTWNIPGCADDQWLEQFMALCAGCRIDALALHVYGCDRDKTLAYLDKRWSQYGLPIWLTEWACPVAWDPIPYMRAVLPELGRYHVEWQSWFGTRPTAWPDYAPLVAGDGTLTPLGAAYVESH